MIFSSNSKKSSKELFLITRLSDWASLFLCGCWVRIQISNWWFFVQGLYLVRTYCSCLNVVKKSLAWILEGLGFLSLPMFPYTGPLPDEQWYWQCSLQWKMLTLNQIVKTLVKRLERSLVNQEKPISNPPSCNCFSSLLGNQVEG